MLAAARLLAPALTRFQEFFRTESASAVLLFICAIVAMGWANSPWSSGYAALWHFPLVLRLGGEHSLDLHQSINDGLMTLFFLLVGLEIKREFLRGEISTPQRALLPLFGALGGMLVPALIFLLFNHGTPAVRGWGVPVATDIAFALGVLALLGKRVPLGLKIFLTALAIIDDLGAVAVIALFYTGQLRLPLLALAALGLALCALLNWRGVTRLWPYAVLGLVVWFAVLQSGIHATVAGVLLAFCIPSRGRLGAASPLERLEHALQQPVAFGVMPLFALANAGVAIGGVDLLAELSSPVSRGICLGLVIGKQIGITFFAWLAVRLKLASLPAGVSWPQLHGVACVSGIGFTMSLFIADLAFGSQAAVLTTAKLGILCASGLAGGGGFLLLRQQLKTVLHREAAATSN